MPRGATQAGSVAVSSQGLTVFQFAKQPVCGVSGTKATKRPEPNQQKQGQSEYIMYIRILLGPVLHGFALCKV